MKNIIKPWGFAQVMCETPKMIVDRLGVLSGHSSLHHHRAMWNRFFVRSGRIGISIEASPGRFNWRELGKDDWYDAPPGVPHRFVVLRAGVVWETYWPAYDGAVTLRSDIVREDVGSGIIDPNKPARDQFAANVIEGRLTARAKALR